MGNRVQDAVLDTTKVLGYPTGYITDRSDNRCFSKNSSNPFLPPNMPLEVLQPNSHTDSAYTTDQCLIIYGIPESTNDSPKGRITEDLSQVQLCIASLLGANEHIEIYKAYRLGSAQPTQKPRPLKLILNNNQQVELLLRKKFFLKNQHPNVFFQKEYSVRERQKRRELTLEIKRRYANGDTNLVIKDGEIVKRTQAFLWQKPFTVVAPV
jgi:hypothetical protein